MQLIFGNHGLSWFFEVSTHCRNWRIENCYRVGQALGATCFGSKKIVSGIKSPGGTSGVALGFKGNTNFPHRILATSGGPNNFFGASRVQLTLNYFSEGFLSDLVEAIGRHFYAD